jgi:hypothetical protein
MKKGLGVMNMEKDDAKKEQQVISKHFGPIVAVIVACAVLIAAWIFMASILFGVKYLALRIWDNVALAQLLSSLFFWFLAPGFGGFSAIYITPRIFKNIDIKIIVTSVISIIVSVVTLALIYLLARQQWKTDIGIVLTTLAQCASFIIGVKIGKSIYIARNSSRGITGSSQKLEE